MSARTRTPSPAAITAAAAAGGAVAAALALGAGGLGQVERGCMLTLAFLLAAVTVRGQVRRLSAPAGLAAFFVAYGGLSAIVATQQPSPPRPSYQGALITLYDWGVVYFFQPRVRNLPDAPFDYTVALVLAVAVAAIAGAALAARLPLRRTARAGAPVRPPPVRALKVLAGILIGLGCVGLALAAGRFATESSGTVWEMARSVWHGGAYFVLLAHFALPGLALLIACMVAEGARRARIAAAVCAMVAFSTLTLATGQRTFLVETAIVLFALWVARRGLRPRQAAAILAAGLAFLVVTQVTRFSIQDSGRVNAGDFEVLEHPEPALRLLGNQFDAFQRSVDVAANRDRIGAPNSLLAVAAKPVPRQLMPGKPDGFALRFTEVVYPHAAADDVALAVPLWAELDYDFGPVAAVAVFLLLGLALGYAERRVRAAQPMLRPLLAVALGWSALVLLRGDLSNAVVGAAGWLLPVAAMVIVAARAPLGRVTVAGEAGRRRLAA